jgi:hypothetical protein
MTLSDYERKEWDRLHKRKSAALGNKARHLLPAAARNRVSVAVDAVRQRAPGADAVAGAYASGAKEFGNIIGRVASHTVSTESVVKQFRDAGYEVDALGCIHHFDLEEVDSVARWDRIRHRQAGMAALSGVAFAGAITGAEALLLKGTVAGGGAKKAPQFGIVATAFAADVASVLGLAARTVASTAQYYGYDPRQPEEQVFMMSVLSLGMAAGTQAKAAAYAELSQLTQLLFRNAAWDKLNKKVLTKIAQQFATKFGVALTKKKLGQVVPVVGMAVGGVLNFALIGRIAEAANDAYRERFLIERSGGELSAPIYGVEAPSRSDDNAIGLIELLQEEDALPSLDLGDTLSAEDGQARPSAARSERRHPFRG